MVKYSERQRRRRMGVAWEYLKIFLLRLKNLSPFLWGWFEKNSNVLQAFGAVALIAYTTVTYLLWRETVKQGRVNAFAKAHEVLADRLSYEIRRYIYTGFAGDLVSAVQNTLKLQPDNDTGKIDTKKVLQSLSLKPDRAILQAFIEKLGEQSTTIKHPIKDNKKVSALEAVEWALLDFDMIAVPSCMRVGAAKEVAKAYKPVLERTAEDILPFVAIQGKLRGDPGYKEHYLRLLERLRILRKFGIKSYSDWERLIGCQQKEGKTS
jgi:hypothetical protein